MLKLGRYIIIFLLFFVLVACASARMAQELQSGKQTFNTGNFTLAFQQLMPLAVRGSPEAQYAVGYMYYYGLGVTAHPDTAVFWMNLSAMQYYPPAVKALQAIHDSNPRTSPKAPPRDIYSENNVSETLNAPVMQKKIALLKQEKEILENPIRIAAELMPENEQDDIMASLKTKHAKIIKEDQPQTVLSQHKDQELPILAWNDLLPVSPSFCEKV